MTDESRDWKPKRLLIGFDGSGGADDAVALAGRLADRPGAAALLVNVLPAGSLPIAYQLLGNEDSPEWRDFFREPEGALDGIATEHRTYLGGSPAKVLNDVAESERIDVAVVGSPHRGAVGRAVLGSVAEALLHGATVAVVAAPRGYAGASHEGFARFVVGYDGSTEADEALRRGASLATAAGRELHVVSVTTLPKAVPFGGVVPPALPDADEVATRGVKSVAPGVEVRGMAMRGDPATQLASYCGQDDLLLVGSRSYGPVARTLLGSVSSKLIHAAPCPVLVVPRPHE